MQQRLSSESQQRVSEPGTVLGIVLFAPPILAQIYWLIVGYSRVGALEEAAWAMYVALLLALSYLMPWKSKFFRAVLWFFKNLHIPRGEYMAVVYAVVLAFVSAYIFFTGSDQIRWR